MSVVDGRESCGLGPALRSLRLMRVSSFVAVPTPLLRCVPTRRLNRLYVLDRADVFGISVFVARDEIGPASERSILSSKLRNYAAVYRTNVSTLTDAGFELLPTFIVPHYTVLLPSLDAANDLAAAFGNLVVNPYAEGREEERWHEWTSQLI